MAHDPAVLSDAAGERDRIDAAHHGGIRADVFSDPMRIKRDREAARLVSLRRPLLDLAHIVRAGESIQSRALVEQHIERIRVHVACTHELEQNTRIQIPGTRSHDEPFERRHAHARFDAAAILDCGDARTVAQVTGNDAQRLRARFQVSGNRLRHVRVARAVKAEAPDAERLRDIARQCVAACTRRQGRVKCRIEYADVR